MAGLHERLFTIIDRTKKPIVAAVHGATAAGGVGLAANAHIVIASPDAKFALTEIKIGLWPVMIFPVLALAMGERRTTELSLTGRFFTAAEAKQYGLVAEIAENPLASFSAHALAKGLDYSRRLRTMTPEEKSAAGLQARLHLMAHPDFAKAVEAFLKR
jgi:enoyl-CoA hydratase/carnithine racemase